VNRVADVDIRLLKVFAAVVEAGGYAGAQSSLNIGSSTISLHMSELEARLGFQLCSRGRGGFRLTERGQRAHEETLRLLAALDDFSSSMSGLQTRLSGRLRIGMVDVLTTHASFPLVEAVRRFNRLDNDVHIEIVVAPRRELERALLAGALDVAIGPMIQMIKGLDFRPLFSEAHCLYCGRGHPLYGRKGALAREDVSLLPFVLRSYHGDFDRRQFGGAEPRASAHDMEGMLVLLLSGHYVGYLPDHYAASWVEKGGLWPLDAPDFTYGSQHMLITRRSGRAPEALGAFLAVLEKSLR